MYQRSSAADGTRHHPTLPASTRRRLRDLVTTTAAAAAALGGVALVPAPASAAETLTADFTGGTGTTTTDGGLYARSGASLTLTVNAPNGTKCISGVPSGFSGATTASNPQTVWTFTGTAPAGDSVHTYTVASSSSYNKQEVCTGQSQSAPASYTSDNTGPTLSPALSPAANAAGWNRTDTTLAWTASDSGAGVATGPTPASSSESANGIVTRTASATDRLGNVGEGSFDVRIDKEKPSIGAAQTRNADGSVTVTFTCDDTSRSGAQQVSGVDSCVVDGGDTNTVVVTTSRSVTGTATDRAGNTASTTVAVEGDSTPPTLTGAPTTEPNAAGWYRGDVTVRWTAADAQSGVPTPPADTTIIGEGTGLTSSTTVRNGAGLSTTATSAPAVDIDRTAPSTGISGGSNGWANGDVTLELAATDNLSGVASTRYAVDGGAEQTGSSVTLSTAGVHTIAYRSTDGAGNVEAVQTAEVRIDKTAPSIGHTFAPSSYADGAWTNGDVTVTFDCADQGGSGVTGCTAPVTKSVQGEHDVTGTATDGAGNTATEHATVRIDKTDPTLTADVVGTRNAAGWYRDDVTVTYTASDDLSGVAGNPRPDVLGEGRGQGASATVTDAAGNSTTAGVTGIDVDKTKPVLTADVPSGWHSDDVTVTWSCADGLSGVADAPADSAVEGEGGNLSATASCTDVAGNTVTRTVDGIRIDRTAPVTTADVQAPLESGWYGGDVEVTLHGSDNLAGTVVTYYTVDDGDAREYDGPFAVGEGEHTVSFWSEDAAGNRERTGTPLELKVDETAPETTVVNPISPDSGWFVTSGIPVELLAADGGSGVAATYFRVDGGDVRTYGEPFTEDLSTGTHTITYWSVDNAGNAERHDTTNTIPVNVDTVAPTITGARIPAANGFGWNNTDVDVTFSCADADSGVAGCAGNTTLANDGAGQSAQGDAVDVAGNRSDATVAGINIDRTKPTLTGVRPDANGAGWYNGDVRVTWQGDDGLSGIDPASQPAPTVVTGEGEHLTAGPVTIDDKAGNTSDPAEVTGIRIDRTAPVITGAPTSEPDEAGWYRGAVTVDFECTDRLSGVASCPTSKLLDGNGADQSVTSDPATDVAGNVSDGRTIGGINIDGAAPSTRADNRCVAVNDWCTGDTADVVLTATDQAGLSGVKEVHYSVNGGAEQVAAGSTTTVSVPLAGSGAGTVAYYAVDNAGNREAAAGVALKWDNIAPTVTHTLSPAANAAGWNNGDVRVDFAARDDDKGSGVATVTQPVTVSAETPGQVVTGTARDVAGNTGTDSVTVRLDRTGPAVSGTVTSGRQGDNGWYTGPVTVGFDCSDGLSGIATCTSPVTLTANGDDNAANGTATDWAGNTASSVVGGIRIDQERPTLTTGDVNVQGRTYTLGGSVPAATCSATDTVSGLASCVVTVSGGNANGVGTFAYTATATDRAGNVSTVTGSYKVVYRFDGFLQPINDTAHQVGTSTSIFKAGSTVPAKLQLKRADGSAVQAVTAPIWITPTRGSASSAPVDEATLSAIPDSGTTYRYDAAAQQYLYNWKTGSGGNYWMIGVRLDDGQTYYVNIGLR